MAKNKTKERVHIGFLIDESGSMSGNQASVVEGYNDFVDSLRGDIKGKDVRATLAMFDAQGFNMENTDILRVKFDSEPLEKVRSLTLEDYNPRGGTPLNDAVVQTVSRMDAKVKRGEKAMLVIMTDGHENSSQTPSSEVKKVIEAREEAGWVVIYLGANQDAWATSEQYGLAKHGTNFTTQATPEGTKMQMRSAAKAASLYADSSKATYDSAMANMSQSLGASLPESVVVDAKEFVDSQVDQDEAQKRASDYLGGDE